MPQTRPAFWLPNNQAPLRSLFGFLVLLALW